MVQTQMTEKYGVYLLDSAAVLAAYSAVQNVTVLCPAFSNSEDNMCRPWTEAQIMNEASASAGSFKMLFLFCLSVSSRLVWVYVYVAHCLQC